MMALLVRTVVPMAVTAAPVPAAKPVPTTIHKANVYTWNVNNPFVRAPTAGKITIDLVKGTCSCTCTSQLAPNTGYWLGIIAIYSSSAAGFGWVQATTDAQGHFKATSTLTTGQLTEVNQILGEVFSQS